MSNDLSLLERESINIIRNSYFESNNSSLLFSGGKDSVVLLHLLHKALHPFSPRCKIVFIDTLNKFKETYEFIEKIEDLYNLDIVRYAHEKISSGEITPTNSDLDTYIKYSKTKALTEFIKLSKSDTIFFGARRDEEVSRSKESIYSIREDNKWNNVKSRIDSVLNPNLLLKNNLSIRVFPLSNWTELDIWRYIRENNLPVNELYFSANRQCTIYDNKILYLSKDSPLLQVDSKSSMKVRFRTLGCEHLTVATKSNASTVDEIINEIRETEIGERETRLMDSTSNKSLEIRKKDGYF